MTYNLGSELLQLDETLAVDSRLLIGDNKRIQIRRGASNFTVNRQTASSLSNNQIIWNVVLNSPKSTVIDSYMYAEIFATCTISATGLTGTVQNYIANNFALRQYPLASVTATSTVTINNQSISTNPSQWIHPLSWSQPGMQDKAVVQSLTPIYPDKSQQYNDMIGSLLSPLNGYYTGGLLYSEPRGVFNADWTTVTGTTGSYVFNFVIHEPIIHPLLDYSVDKTREALAFINNFNIQLQFTAYLSRMFSLNATACPNITGVSVNLNSANLVMSWLTLPVNQKIPSRTLRSFTTLVSQSTLGIPITSGSQFTINSQSYSLNQIPKKIWIYINNSAYDVSTGYTLTDTFFAISNINILFNNRQSLLGNMTASDLWNNCAASTGCRITYIESQHYVGSVLELDPVILFGLQDDQSTGCIGTYNFTATVQATNISSGTITPSIWVVTANDSVLSTSDASISNLIQGYVSQEDVIRANNLPAIPTLYIEHDLYGGGFLDTLKNFGSRALGFLKDSKLLSNVANLIPHPAAQAVGRIASNLGLGGRYTPRREAMANYESLVH